jgi:serine/threonine-protein kinase
MKHVVRNKDKDVRFIEQLENEYEVSKNFNHPNLRRSYDLKVVKTLLLKKSEAFLVMELFDGKSLETRPPSSLLEVTDAFIPAAQGLHAMHKMGYVHCDIKPNNIMRDVSGNVKVIDFGQSARIGTTKERIQGTPDYIAPEQVERRPIMVQTDIYNLGATIYWCLTGKPIPTQYTVSKKGENSFLLDTLIASPQSLNAGVPTALSNLVMECVSTNWKKRPADMEQLISRLELVRHVIVKGQQAQVASESPSPAEGSAPT